MTNKRIKLGKKYKTKSGMNVIINKVVDKRVHGLIIEKEGDNDKTHAHDEWGEHGLHDSDTEKDLILFE